MVRELRLPRHAGLLRRHHKDRQQHRMPAGETVLVTVLHVAATHAGTLLLALHLRPANQAAGRVKARGLRPAGEPGVVDFLEVDRQLVATLHQARNPAGGATLPTLHHRQIHAVPLTRQVAFAAQADFIRIGRELAHHPAQLTHPHLHPQGHQGLIPFAQRPSHEHQQSIQHLADLGLAGIGQVPGKHLDQALVAGHTPLEQLQEVHEHLVALEQLAQVFAPGGILDVPGVYRSGFFGKEQPKPRRNRLGWRTVARGLERRRRFTMEAEHEVHHRVFQKHPDRLPVLHHHGLRRERHTEHLPSVFAQRRGVRTATERGRSARADQMLRVDLQPRAQTPQQQGQIRSLGAVEAVQLVHHHIAQRGRRVGRPQLAVQRPQHQIVEHLVVGQQDVGRVLAQGGPVRNHRVRRHHHAVPCVTTLTRIAANVETNPQSGKSRNAGHQLRDAPRLIRGQRVHRINDQ